MTSLLISFLQAGASLPATAGVTEDIRDIRGPIAEAAPWWAGLEAWGLAALGVAALAVGLTLIVRALRRPKNARQAALARIARAERHASARDARAFAHEVSEAVRAYVEARFGVHAPQRTTEELLEELAAAESSPLSRYRPLLAAFLARCDLAKFGGARLELTDMKALSDSAREFVEASWREREHRASLAPAPGGAS